MIFGCFCVLHEIQQQKKRANTSVAELFELLNLRLRFFLLAVCRLDCEGDFRLREMDELRGINDEVFDTLRRVLRLN